MRYTAENLRGSLEIADDYVDKPGSQSCGLAACRQRRRLRHGGDPSRLVGVDRLFVLPSGN